MLFSRRLLPLLAAVFLLAAPAWAEPQDVPVPTPTSDGYIAMLYYRMTGQMPDFEAWAMASDAYAKAGSFDKDLVRKEKAAEAARAYHLVAFDDLIVVRKEIALSPYSRSKKGFFVEGFGPDTFFPYHFIGRSYALVPLDLMDFQWVSVEDERALKKIEEETNTTSRKAMMYIYLTPTVADKQTPLKIDDKEYWLVSGRVDRVQLFDDRSKTLLWEGFGKNHVRATQKEVLDLYK